MLVGTRDRPVAAAVSSGERLRTFDDDVRRRSRRPPAILPHKRGQPRQDAPPSASEGPVVLPVVTGKNAADASVAVDG